MINTNMITIYLYHLYISKIYLSSNKCYLMKAVELLPLEKYKKINFPISEITIVFKNTSHMLMKLMTIRKIKLKKLIF